MLRSLFLAVLLVLTAPAYASQPAIAPLPVVASFSILGDIVRQIGGDVVAVTTLVGPDGDAHGYAPTPQDARAVAAARLVVANGLGFDSWLPRLVKASAKSPDSRAVLVTASDGITTRADDPHAWQDVSNVRRYAATIAAALIKARPDAADAIRQRAAAYDAQLAALNAEIKKTVAAIPAARRVIVTSHDAFGYFGAAYGVEFLAPEGINTDAEPSAAAIAKLQQQIAQYKIHTVFLENMSNPRLLQQIGRDTGATVGGTLYADALSNADGPAPDYMAMMRYNVRLLIAAMQSR